jgi:hypothetical protein
MSMESTLSSGPDDITDGKGVTKRAWHVPSHQWWGVALTQIISGAVRSGMASRTHS